MQLKFSAPVPWFAASHLHASQYWDSTRPVQPCASTTPACFSTHQSCGLATAIVGLHLGADASLLHVLAGAGEPAGLLAELADGLPALVPRLHLLAEPLLPLVLAPLRSRCRR